MKAKHLLLAIGIAITLLITGMGAVAGALIWRERSLPVYTMAQEYSPDGQVVTGTLTLGGVCYVNSMAEFPLYPLGRGGQVGRTADGMRVHALAGAGANRDYLILTGFMFPDILYRRDDVPAFDPQRAPIGELRLFANVGRGPVLHSTQDPALIGELLACLRDPGPLTAASEPYDMFQLQLLSAQAPGIYYLLYAALAPDGRVYLAERAAPEQWITAGDALAQWVGDALGPPARFSYTTLFRSFAACGWQGQGGRSAARELSPVEV